MNPKDALGRRGEQLAADYLERLGFRILDRNWRCADGELDIIAMDRQTLVACEVKTRSGDRFGTPVESVSRAKLRRLRRLAVLWVTAHGLIVDEIRVDIIGVLRNPAGGFRIDHLHGVG